MVLFDQQALIARCSNKILFFKQEFDLMLKKYVWINYHQIKEKGFVYYIKGNIRIQITTETKIYFYIMDKETLMPKLENVMFNYMECNQMMFGSRVRYGITYKNNQPNFNIYRRMYVHNIQSCVNTQNFAGSKAVSVVSSNLILVTKVDRILMFDIDTF